MINYLNGLQYIMLILIVHGKGAVMKIDWINNYPRKLFNYKSANDIFYENLNDYLKCCNRF